MSATKSGRTYHSIDIGKMVAAIFVVAIHAEPFTGVAEELVINVLARMAVPFFFLTSSFFFFRKSPERQNPMAFLRRLAILYAFWFIVELPITVLHSFIEPSGTFLQNLLVFCRNFLLGSTFRGSWFIMSLGQGVIIVWLLSKRIPNIFIIGIGLFCYLLVMASNVFVDLLPAWWAELVRAGKQYLGEIQLSFMASLVFCALGKWVAEHEKALTSIDRRHVGLMLLGLLLVSVAEVLLTNDTLHPKIYESYLMLIFITPCLFVWLLQNEIQKDWDYIRYRRYSTIFFFSHFIFVFILVIVNKHVIAVNPLLKYGIVLVACWLTARMMLSLSQKKDFHWLSSGF